MISLKSTVHRRAGKNCCGPDRCEFLDLMGELKLYGMLFAYDEVMATSNDVASSRKRVGMICIRHLAK